MKVVSTYSVLVLALGVRGATLCIFSALTGSGSLLAGVAGKQELAQEIIERSGVRGGLVVHVGCGNGELTAALRVDHRYLVQGLTTEEAEVRAARRLIQKQGTYGVVSVDRFDGKRLPYVSNLANLVVAEDLGDVDMAEVVRVLCPRGVAYIRDGDDWKKTVKPRPPELDEWTHYLYDASGNAVSKDRVVGPPRHFQWIGSPRWSRHHDRRASVSAMVAAGGRLFYIFDEGSTASILLPPKPVVAAKDAFNGMILWKRSIPKWFPHLWPFKSGPAQLQRRLVAVDDRVYVTLGLDAPLTALDAASGETVRTYENSLATEEVILHDGILFLLVNEEPQVYDDFRPEEVGIGAERDRIMRDWPWNEKPRRIQAVRAGSGEVLWQKERKVAPLTLAADQQRVYFHDGDRVVALDRAAGQEVWSSDPVERQRRIPANITPTLVVYRDVVLFYGATRKLTGISAATGKLLWTQPHPRSGHYCPEDVLVAGGLVWGGEIAGGRDSGEFIGRDPRTGEVKSRFLPDIDIYFMHHRCYRSKATERFLIPGWTGTEFIDFRAKHWVTNHWVRSGCIYGVLPGNGLLYTTSHDCACYMQAKLNGFCALAPSPEGGGRPPSPGDRFEKGPAYGKVDGDSSFAVSGADWPTYRHDRTRSGATKASLAADLKPTWSAKLGGRLSSVTIAGGLLFVASVDRHTLHALDASSGESRWSYTAGGRVDSPPTVFEGRALFGSADGWVYCLRASDGELVWRRLAAFGDRRMTSFEQVESVWPVHGSVLVQDGIVYCIAGRSMFVDGGMRFLKLDAKTGKTVSERILDHRDPSSGKDLQVHVEVRNMPVALPDILSSDGKHVYMRSQTFDLDGNRGSLAQIKGSDADRASQQQGEEAHLFSPTGFLDDTWWHRSYWVWGRRFAEGAGGWPQAGRQAPAGRILSVDESTVYGFGRKPRYFRWRTPLEYQLFATRKQPELVRQRAAAKRPKAQKKKAKKADARPRKKDAAKKKRAADKRKKAAPKRVPLHPEYLWTKDLPFQVRAMVLAEKTLFIAGPPDVVDEEAAFLRTGDPEIQAQLARQDAALHGAEGAVLQAVSAEDGTKKAEIRLDSLPVFDGMAAANGRLYVVTTDGRIRCFTPRPPAGRF